MNAILLFNSSSNVSRWTFVLSSFITYYRVIIVSSAISSNFSIVSVVNKQLLDEVAHDIMNYQNRGLCYLPQPSASADNTDLGFDYS